MSSIISSGPIASAAGLANSAAGLIKTLTAKAVLMQFEFNPDDPAYSSAHSNLILKFDAVVGDTITQQSQPTAYPVEDASSITDHITRLPLQIDLVGVVSDTPIAPTKALFQQEAVTSVASAILPPLGVVGASLAASFVNATPDAARPSVVALNTLRQLQVGNPFASTPIPPKPFSAVSRIGRWDNMMISNLVVPRDVDTGDALIFQISLVQVNVVRSQQVPLGILQNQVLAGGKRALGAQSSADVSNSASDQNNLSSAFSAGDTLGYGLAGPK